MKTRFTPPNKNTKEISTNRLILPAFFIVCSLILEIVTFLWLRIGQLLPSKLFLDLGFMLVVAGLIYIAKKKWAMISVFFFFITIQVVMDAINANIYSVFGDIFTFDYFKLGQEAKDAISWEYIDFAAIGLYVGILAVIIAAVVLLFVFNKKTITVKHFSIATVSLALLLVFESCGVTMFACQTSSIVSAEADTIENNTSYLWDSFTFKLEAYRQFGFWGFYCKCLADQVFSSDDLTEEEQTELLEFIEAGKTTTDDLDGSLEGYNLIMILCESNEWFAYDPYNTPFVWSLITGTSEYGGTANFTNFYGHNKTNISETIALTGSVPAQTTMQTLFQSDTYGNPYTLPKLFAAANEGEDLQLNYFHTWKRTFYARDPGYMSGFGFQNYYSIENYETNNPPEFFGDWVSDYDFVSQFMDEFVPDSSTGLKFMTSFATMTTHGLYDYENPRYEEYYEIFDENLDEYVAWLAETGYDEYVTVPTDSKLYQRYRHYKAAAIDFDKTIQLIFTLLERRGHLDDTLVVMYADHNAYNSNLTNSIKGISKTEYYNTQIFKIPMMIYGNGIQSGNYDCFCNTYDIFPTICELLGLTYNKSLTHGFNVFDEEVIQNSFFASNLGGMFDDKFYSKNIADVVALVDDYTDEDLANFKTKAETFYQNQRKLELIYKYNLAA